MADNEFLWPNEFTSNKKVLQRERKRHTTRRVASARYADLSRGGTPSQVWGGTPSHVWGVPRPRSGGVPRPMSGGYPIPGQGVTHPMSGGYPVPCLGGTPSHVWGGTPSQVRG